MLQIHALLDQLREWSESDPDSVSRVSSMLLGVLIPDISLPMKDAPAHPDDMRAWLTTIISSRATAAISRSDAPVVPIRFDNLARVLPLVLRNTEPSDWPDLPAKVGMTRGVISYSKDDEGMAQAMLEDSLVQQNLRALGGVSIEASGWSKKRMKIAFQEHWRWPLSIVVDDVWLTNRRMQRLGRVLDHLGFARFVPYSNSQPGAIRLIDGNADEVLRALGSSDKDHYAYILGTGALNKVRDLKRITNKVRSVGAAMLGWEQSEVPRRLAAMLTRIRRSTSGSDTLDVWLNATQETRVGLFYAFPDALAMTAPKEAGNLLCDSVFRHIHDTDGADSRLVEALSIDPSNPLSIFLSDILVRVMPETREKAGVWLRQVGELTQAATAAGLLSTPRALDLVGGSDRDIDVYVLPENATSLKIASPKALDYFVERIGAIDIGSSADSSALDLDSGPTTLQAPRMREVSAQATLMCDGRPMSRLNPAKAHVLQVQLASADLQEIRADSPFPIDRLPSEDSSVPLTLFLVPLTGVQPQHRGVAQRVDCLFQKAAAKSEVCLFSLIAAPDAIEYKARLLILHANRVLQSLMLEIPGASAHENAVMQLVAENVVRADFSHLAKERIYDLAIVSNHDAAAQNGFMMLTKDKVEFREPKSFARKLAAVSAQLKSLNETAGNGTAKGRHAQLTYSLNELANLGNDMRELLCGGNRDLEALTADHGNPSNPVRIQVVEAVADAFLPVEIFYDGPAPLPEAPLCAKAASPDYPMRTCGGCADRQRDDLICPSRFWGLSKVIERRPYVADAISSGADFAVSVSQLRYAKVPAFRSIVYGLSAKFKKREQLGIAASLKKLSRQVLPAGSWAAWKTAVAKHGPEMLVAIGHVEQRLNAIDALEIGDEHLRSTNVTSSHIRKSDGAVPVVVLLGCGTLYAENELGNFVRHFSRHGAGLIVATIASMLTVEAQLCVDAITQAFDEARASGVEGDSDGHNTVGFAVLRAKQTLLAAGSGLGLALTGAGDSEWEF